MAEYPAQEESDVVLKDGSTLRLRPIRPDDGPNLLGLYEKLSEASLYFRFFAVPKADTLKAQELAQVDYDSQFALVAESGRQIVGVARYYRYPKHPGEAEVAFTVADALHGHGLGTRLLERLAEIAAARGIDTFRADVLPGNRRMMDVFLQSGLDLTYRLEQGVMELRLSLARTAGFEEKAAARAQKAAAASMRLFFEPRAVAVVGANRARGQIGSEILHNLKATGFTGRLCAVHPSASEIDGVPSYRSLTDVPGEVDLAVVSVPAAAVEAVLDDALAKGVKAIVVITAGFGETGPEGRQREAALVARLRDAGARMVGPNCMGILNTDPRINLNATFAPVWPPQGRIAMSSQSGALGLAILDYARQLEIGFSTFVSMGNKADVSGNDLIQYWAEDPRTDVILLYLESFGNPRKFGQLARRISRQKPIVCVKAGRSSSGARAASSHTGALAASDAVVDALFRHAGVIRTGTLQELFDVAMLLAHQPVPAGRGVAILTNAGGPGILASDACEAAGLQLPVLSEATASALRALLPAAASFGNPVDMLASASADDYRRALEILLSDPNIDSVLVIFIPPLVTAAEDVARAILAGARGARGKTVLATFMSAQGTPALLAPIPCYPFPESAATALARVTSYGQWRKKPEGTVPAFADLDAEVAQAVVSGALSRGGGWLTAEESQRLLASAGIGVARSRFAEGAEAAAAAASLLGFPVAVKASGPTILHKTEVGGVKLGLSTPDAVRTAVDELRSRLGPDLRGVVVQEMVESGVEVMAGAVCDPVFGPVVAYGSGGVLVELLGDVAFRIHPLTDADVKEMLEEVKATRLIRGFRGSTPADEAALVEVLLRVSALLTACPEIQEMDFNPVKVLSKGVRVVDARIRVDRRPPAPPSRRVRY